MRKKLVFIFGMHRSGTSLVAKATQVIGAYFGDNLLPPGPDNPKGFWEDQDVFAINNDLLESIDLRWDIPTTAPLVDFKSKDLIFLRTRAAALLKEKLEQSDLIGIKDPRLCLTLPFWLELADEQKIETFCVIAVRNPIAVANSLYVRNEFELLKGLLLWVNYNYLVLHQLIESNKKSLFIDYQKILENPDIEIKRLSKFIKEKRNKNSDKINQFITNYIDKRLCHYSVTENEIKRFYHSIPEAALLYQALIEFANNQWSKTKAKSVIEKIDRFKLEAKNYQYQLGFFKIDLEKKLAEKAQELENKKLSEIEWFKRKIDQREIELKELDKKREQEVSELMFKNKREVAAIREQYEQQLKQVCNLQKETDKHLRGALQQINDIKTSFSYRLGRALTWPARVVYDIFIEPFKRYPSNILLLFKLITWIIRHPINAFRLFNLERVRNAYITFLKNPQSAGKVVSYYGRIFGESFDQSTVPQFSGDRESASGKVSIIVVNYNGVYHLPELFSSIQNQTYHNFELIFVDNGSTDRSVEYVKKYFSNSKIIALRENVGFAEGCNIAAEVADGEYLCLVNNDVVVDPNWLFELVKCIEADCKIGAVGSKILFWKKFVQIKIKVGNCSCAWLDLKSLEDSLQIYPKWFFDVDQKCLVDGVTCIKFSDNLNAFLPICNGQSVIKFRLLVTPRDQASEILINSPTIPEILISKSVSSQWSEFQLDFQKYIDDDRLFFLINNAGSEVNNFGEVKDRGFAEPDRGQYDQIEYVSSLCGASMLIRKSALQGRPLFPKFFFSYFEDTELSLRLRKAGYDLVYCPKSVLYHKHASTSRENSSFFKYYVSRNKILFLACHYPRWLWQAEMKNLESNLLYLMDHNSNTTDLDNNFRNKIPQILKDWRELIPVIESGKYLDREKLFPRIAVYNSFWNTLGGAEHHAAVIAQVLQKFGPVDLISEQDFDIPELEKRFDLNLKFCRKVVVSPECLHYDSKFTRQYDIFVNSTFGSDLKCNGKLSYYVVSFPYELTSRPTQAKAFLHTYHRFLANSEYTAHWIKKWWNVDSDVLYPSINIADSINPYLKQNLILSVGRFFKLGHNKKQLEMVKVFKKLYDEGFLSEGWRLVLVGQVHYDQEEYLDIVKREAFGYPVDIYIDTSPSDLKSFYSKAAIYWHATGLNENSSKNPELFEHFGISTLEAMSYGCVPIVINGGGQKEIVQHGINGFLFSNEKELIEFTKDCVVCFSSDKARYAVLSQSATERARQFSREVLEQKLLSILERDGFKIPAHYSLI